MIYLLDTDHISILQNRASREFPALSARIATYPKAEIGLSIVSFHEQTVGVQTFLSRAKKPEDLARGYRFYDSILASYCSANIVPFDLLAIAKFNEFRKSKIRLGTMDLRIAAIAVVNRLRLVTRNRSDFEQISELTIEDWMQ